MSLARLFAQRIALGLVTAWAVLTGIFALFTLTEDWVLGGIIGGMRFAGAEEEELEQARREYLAERGLDRPFHEQYADWMGNMVTLQWGESFETGEAVLPLIAGSVGRTAAYVLPAIVLAVCLGLAIGLYAAMNPDGRLANAGLDSTYLLFALPNFWIGGIALSLVWGDDPAVGYSPLVFEHVLPIALTATTLVGGYASYSRAHSLEYTSSKFVALLRAKGAGPLAVARHVLRNAAIPVVSMLFTEALGLLILGVFVIEVLFGIEGFGLLLFDAVRGRDLPVLLGGTLVIIGVGVAGNILQDLSYSILDPRVDTGSRR